MNLRLLMIASAILTSATVWSAESFRYLVMTREQVDAKSFASQLPKGASLLAQQGELLWVQVPSKDLVKQLEKISGVMAVEADREAFPLADENCPNCGSTNRSPTTGVERQLEQLKSVSAPKKCEWSKGCPNGISPTWAQDAVDADLMKEETNRIAPGVTAPVAVVDSGFDRAQAKNFETVGAVRAAKGVELLDKHFAANNTPKDLEIGDPYSDESGHGTMVASVIGGKGKLGVAQGVSLSVYRVTKPTPPGELSSSSTSNAVLQMAAYKACLENPDPSGLTIVNLSWGARFDESGIERDEDTPVGKLLLTKLAEKGCLVMKAAGNSAFRKLHPNNLDDAYLRVAATDSSNELADFSSQGEINAPGAAVFVLESTGVDFKAPPSRKCGPDEGLPKRFVNGTSFAAPMAAGVASQVVRVLKAGGRFKTLPNPERIKLVNKIMKSSMQNNSINGLRAVRIAQVWSQQPGVAPEKALSSYPDPSCGNADPKCSSNADCAGLASCTALARRKLALCETASPRLAANLATVAFDFGMIEMGSRFSRHLKASNDSQASRALNEQAVETILSARGYVRGAKDAGQKTSNQNVLLSLPVNFVKTELASYFEYCADSKVCDPAFMTELARASLGSRSVIESLVMGLDPSTGEDRGSGEAAKAVKNIIVSAKEILGTAKVAAMVAEYAEASTKLLKQMTAAGGARKDFGLKTVVPARILDQLASADPSFAAAESKYAAQVFSMNEFFRGKTEDIPIYGEIFPIRSTFDGVISRNRNLIDQAVETGKLDLLAPVQMFYLLSKLESEPRWSAKRKEVLAGVVERIFQGRGWGLESDSELLDSVLVTIADDKDPSWKPRLSAWISGSTNLQILSKLAESIDRKRAIGRDPLDISTKRTDWKFYSSHPHLDPVVTAEIPVWLAMTIADVPEAKRSELGYPFNASMAAAIKILSGDSVVSEGSARVLPRHDIPYPTRLNPAVPPQTRVVESRGAMLDRILQYAIEMQGRSATQGMSNTVLDEVSADNAALLKAARALPGWKRAAEKMIAESRQLPDPKSPDYKIKLKPHPREYNKKSIEKIEAFLNAAR